MPRCSRLFGLSIRSELPLSQSVCECSHPDIDVVYDFVPEQLPGATSSGIRYQARPGRLLLKVDGVARYMICDGRRVVIDRDGRADDDDVRAFLVGSAFGALLHQRGALVLHGSAVVIDGAAVAFVGPSGIGKSTLSMAFRQRGMPVLTDDLCVIDAAPDGGALHVLPGTSESKLWIDSLQHLAIPADGLRRVRNRLEKRALPLGAAFAETSAPLEHLYVLKAIPSPPITVTRLHGPQKFGVLRNQTYRLQFLEAMGGKRGHFRTALQLAAQASISVVARPRGEFLLDELVEKILADLQA
jgi:hypothetical protein